MPQDLPGKTGSDRKDKRGSAKSPSQRDVPEVRSFLGLYNVYRKFVKYFTKIATPLKKAEQGPTDKM